MKRHVVIATPMYGGQIRGATADAIAIAMCLLTLRGDRVTRLRVEGESLVTRARNVLVTQFLATGGDTLAFIDNDMAFDPHDLLKLVDSGEDVVAGAYAKKDGSGTLVLEQLPNPAEKGDLTEVARIGTGFLFISREALLHMIRSYPETMYEAHGNGAREIHFALFDTALRDGRYLSEDYLFCDRWRALDKQVWLSPVRVGHIDGGRTYWP